MELGVQRNNVLQRFVERITDWLTSTQNVSKLPDVNLKQATIFPGHLNFVISVTGLAFALMVTVTLERHVPTTCCFQSLWQ